jgi:hypothetical protein
MNLYCFVWCNPTVGYCMSKRVLGFVCIKEACYEGTVSSSFPSANTFFCILGPVPLVSFWHGLPALWIRIFSVNCNVCFPSLGCLLTYILPFLYLNTPRYLEFSNVCWCQQAEIHAVEVCSFLLLFFPNGHSGYCNALENLKLHTAIFWKLPILVRAQLQDICLID